VYEHNRSLTYRQSHMGLGQSRSPYRYQRYLLTPLTHLLERQEKDTANPHTPHVVQPKGT